MRFNQPAAFCADKTTSQHGIKNTQVNNGPGFFFTLVSELESDNNYEMGAGMKVLLTRECGLDSGF